MKRFNTQAQVLLSAVRADLARWWTLRELSHATGICETSLSAQLRNLRKPPLDLRVQKRRLNGGVYEYRVQL